MPSRRGALPSLIPVYSRSGQILLDGSVLVHESGARPLVADLLVALYLLLERHDPEDKRLGTRRTSRHVDVHWNHPIGTHEHRVPVEERSA